VRRAGDGYPCRNDGGNLPEWGLCYAPPYLLEKDPVNMIGYAIENILTGKVRQFHWHVNDIFNRCRQRYVGCENPSGI